MIRVLLVDDSPVVMTFFKRMLASTAEILVVGCARTGTEGLKMIPQVQPHVICTDLLMPEMDGLTFIKEVMEKFPRPILVISASVQSQNTEKILQLLQAGVVDVFPKPLLSQGESSDIIRQELITKIKILSGVAVFMMRQTVVETPQKYKSLLASPPSLSLPIQKIVALGASTGGPQALYKVLSTPVPVPVLCVQHIYQGFLQGLIDWLNTVCSSPVKIAVESEMPVAGTIYFAPEEHHLELDYRGRFHLSTTPQEGHRPSITVTFNSIAKVYGSKAIGILLTGMGRDGAEGMQAIYQAGGITIAQDEKTSVVFGMPKEAIALNAASLILPLPEIAPTLHKILTTPRNI